LLPVQVAGVSVAVCHDRVTAGCVPGLALNASSIRRVIARRAHMPRRAARTDAGRLRQCGFFAICDSIWLASGLTGAIRGSVDFATSSRSRLAFTKSLRRK